MQSYMTVIFWTSYFVLYVQARSIEKNESDTKREISESHIDNRLNSEKYYKLLTYLLNNRIDEQNEDNEDEPSENTNELPKRGIFLFPTRRTNQRMRPSHSYGRKSHWDTFFG